MQQAGAAGALCTLSPREGSDQSQGTEQPPVTQARWRGPASTAEQDTSEPWELCWAVAGRAARPSGGLPLCLLFLVEICVVVTTKMEPSSPEYPFGGGYWSHGRVWEIFEVSRPREIPAPDNPWL